MARNAREMRIARKGRVLTAPLDTPIPATAAELYVSPWVDLGHADDSGVELEPSKETGSLGIWSSAAPGLWYLESAGFQVNLNLVQPNRDVTEFFWDAEWQVNEGSGTLDISANPPIGEKMLAVVWESQQGYLNHVIVERGAVTNRQNITLNRTTGVYHGVQFSAMPEAENEVERLARLLTNDPAIIGEVSSP